MNPENNKKRSKKRGGKNPAAAVCSALGSLTLILLIAICLPLTAPKAFGYHIYTVISGSMEPAIPIGSLLYIQSTEPEGMMEGDIIAYYGAQDLASLITHRVVENRVLMGEFITKGDANSKEDMHPIPYDNFIGKVVLSIPKVGTVAQILTSQTGKIAAACAVTASVLLHLTASWLDGKKHRDQG